jgi:hypothetical protein
MTDGEIYALLDLGYGKRLRYKYKSNRKDDFFKKGVVYNILIKPISLACIEIDVANLPQDSLRFFHPFHFFELFKVKYMVVLPPKI